MNKKSRDLACLGLAGAMVLFSLGSMVAPRKSVLAEADPAQPSGPRATVIEPDSPEILEQRRLMAERASEQEALRQERARFIEVWGERIDEFNAGYPLEGYGKAFAKAAYDNGVDPRFAPAIARVESGSGKECFAPHNAWGWHGSSWSDWDTAIAEYLEALGEGYGYTLSYAGAAAYNNVSTDLWYAQVSTSMQQIWPTDEL